MTTCCREVTVSDVVAFEAGQDDARLEAAAREAAAIAFIEEIRDGAWIVDITAQESAKQFLEALTVSSAAAALLAQGEALKWYGDSDNWEYEHSPECEESAPSGPCIADLACRPSCAAEKDEGRRARAALAPGEPIT